MHHENHNIKEAILLIKMGEDDTSVIQEFSYISEELGNIGFKFNKTQTPVSLKFEIEGGRNISHKVEDGASQIVFKSENTNIYCVLSDSFLSFHSVQEYKGWGNFKEVAVLPCIEALKPKFSEKSINSVQMTYINEFPIDCSKEIVSDYLRHNFPASEFVGSRDWVQNHQVVLKIDSDTELNLFSQLVITSDTNIIRLVPTATITNVNKLFKEIDRLELLDKVHQLANDLFMKSVTDKYIEKIG
jgi:uncharacterized protein (TIGR04255 family)